ncbi:phosphotransferase [Deinococcus sp.]|uniref:phosphotransferase n=1 Tax=Deinococcus sp. TaxID=47478 RepID=UPI003CC637A2
MTDLAGTDPSGVARLLAAQFPDLDVLAVTRLGEGLDHVAYEVNGRYVFRLPKSSRAGEALETEARLTAWLAPLLPLRIPQYVWRGQRGGPAPLPLAGYPKLPGTPGLLVAPEQLDIPRLGAALGAFLAALHAQDVRKAEELGLPQDDDPQRAEWSAAALDDLKVAQSSGQVGQRRKERLETLLGHPPAGRPRHVRVLHADFAAEHVLLDEHGAATAVIDWSDASIGDAAQDWAGLLHWGGLPLLHTALNVADSPAAGLLERAGWYAACRAVADLAYGEREGRPEYSAAGQRALALLEAASVF